MVSFYEIQVLLNGHNRIHEGLFWSHDLVFNIRCGSVGIGNLAVHLPTNNGKNVLCIDLEPWFPLKI